MKINSHQLEQHLKKNIASLYLISGDETLLVQEAIDCIRKAAQAAGFSERVRIPTESDWGKLLYNHMESLSLFSDKRLLELDLTNVKLTAASSKLLQEISQNIPTDILLLIRIHKVDSKTEKSAWYQALEKKGIAIPVWPITTEQLPQWLIQRAKKINIDLTLPAAQMLATQVEGNLLAASQEIEKLSLLTQTTIDVQTIENNITDHSHFDIFALVDSVLLGKHRRSLCILQTLSAQDTEPVLILWALTRELRTLATMAHQVKKGTSLSSLFATFRIWEKRQPAVRAFLQRHPEQTCLHLLTFSAQIDKIIKGLEKGNPWNTLEKFILKL